MQRLTLALLVACSGCTSWQVRTGVLTQPLGLRDQVQLCVAGKCRQVHGVRVYGDSVRAVPYFQNPDCDSCAVRFALSDLDAVKTRRIDRDKTIFFGVVMTPILLLLYAASQIPET